MKKILFFLLILAFMSVYAHATDHYFDNGSPDNTLPCTIGDPCDNFSGTTLDNAGAIACGDTINLKAGETWIGQEAEIIIRSGTTSCSGNPIKVQRYGSGANPILAGSDITTAGWSVHSGAIYKNTQSQTNLWTVTQDDNKALGYYSGTNTTLPEGTFKREGSTLYVRLWGDEDPSTNTVRIGDYTHPTGRGLLSAGSFADGDDYGHYVDFKDITIIGANGVGFSLSGTNSRTTGLSIVGAAWDGWLAYSNLGGSLENSDNFRDFGSSVTYSAAGANGGGGYGQGWTSYSSYGWWVGSRAEYNFMAGFDWLNFGPTTNVTETGCLWCKSYYSGIAKTDPSYDPAFYIDGGTKVFLYGIIAYGGGTGAGTAANARNGVTFGTEHDTDPAENGYLINSLIYGTHWIGAATSTTTDTNNVKNMTFAYNTLVGYDAGSFEMVLLFDDVDTTADNFIMRNNILYAAQTWGVNFYMDSGAYLDADYNQYYVKGQASDTTDIYAGEADRNLSEWVTASGEDANSDYGDPLLVSFSDTAMDADLQNGSPAIDSGTLGAYTVPTWLPTALKNYLGTQGIRGTTRASGAQDDVTVAPDRGYHYDYADLTSTNVEPASLVASASGNATVSFTIPDPMGWIPYNGKIKVTLPAGYTINSGGTTAASNFSGISGTGTVGVSGQVITVTRAGDGVSEFPGDFSFTLSHIGNSGTPGATGTYDIKVTDASDNIIAGDSAVASDTILSGTTAHRFSCGPGVIFTGVKIS